MGAFIVGAIIVGSVSSFAGAGWPLAAVLFLLAASTQVTFTRLLNGLLGGEDPFAKYGARNLCELRACIPIPIVITALSFLAQALGWAALIAVMFTVGF